MRVLLKQRSQMRAGQRLAVCINSCGGLQGSNRHIGGTSSDDFTVISGQPGKRPESRALRPLNVHRCCCDYILCELIAFSRFNYSPSETCPAPRKMGPTPARGRCPPGIRTARAVGQERAANWKKPVLWRIINADLTGNSAPDHLPVQGNHANIVDSNDVLDFYCFLLGRLFWS